MHIPNKQSIKELESEARSAREAIQSALPHVDNAEIREEALKIAVWAVGQSYAGNELVWEAAGRRTPVDMDMLRVAKVRGIQGKNALSIEGISARQAVEMANLPDVEMLRDNGMILLAAARGFSEKGYRLKAINARIRGTDIVDQYKSDGILPGAYSAEALEPLLGYSPKKKQR